jgi:hypothetical protein
MRASPRWMMSRSVAERLLDELTAPAPPEQT